MNSGGVNDGPDTAAALMGIEGKPATSTAPDTGSSVRHVRRIDRHARRRPARMRCSSQTEPAGNVRNGSRLLQLLDLDHTITQPRPGRLPQPPGFAV